MTFVVYKLLIVAIGTLLIGAVGWLSSKGTAQRLMLLAVVSGLFVYSGAGTSLVGVPDAFVWIYLLFLFALVLGFLVGRVVFFSMAEMMGRSITSQLGPMDRGSLWMGVLVGYVFLSLFPLVWPEMRLDQLLSPPAPNLLSALGERFYGESDPLLRLVEYVRLLLTPFFLLALYRLRFRLDVVGAILFVLLYLQYVREAYLGRGAVVLTLVTIVLSVWLLRPKYRGRLVILIVAAVPALVYALYLYAKVRIGDAVADVGIMEAGAAILETELAFVRDVGSVILQSNARVDLSAYLYWVVTLPLPKLFVGPVEVARINYEISEIVLGVPIGAYGWYVVLPGLVAESVYIFGRNLFLIHGMVLGLVAAFFVRLTERVPQFFFIYLHLVVMFGYALNRGGVSSLFPELLNKFLFFYLFLALFIAYRHCLGNGNVINTTSINVGLKR